MNSAREVIDKAVKEGKLKVAGEILSDGGEEGWWIPRYMLEKHPELTTLAAVLKRPDLFPNPEDKKPRRAVHMPVRLDLPDHHREPLQGV